MDIDLEAVEIVLAQKLACGEPPIRARAFRELQRWLKQQSNKKRFGDDDLMRLCKGLHYVMWMQDKMIMHEELADKIANLLTMFETEDERARFVKFFLVSLNKEWFHIDKWRMDKFLMSVRRLVRAVFCHLAETKWNSAITDLYWDAFKSTVLSPDPTFCEALKFHFASLFLDEADHAGSLSTERLTQLLQSFADFIGGKVSDAVFTTVVDEVFVTILHSVSEEMVEDEDGEDETDRDERRAAPQSGDIKFDFAAIGKLLFDVGKKPEVKSRRRNVLYDVSKKFTACSRGVDPLAEPDVEAVPAVKYKRIKAAAERVLKMNETVKEDRVKSRKAHKAPGGDSATMAMPDIKDSRMGDDSDDKEKKKKKKKMTSKKATQKQPSTGGSNPARKSKGFMKKPKKKPTSLKKISFGKVSKKAGNKKKKAH